MTSMLISNMSSNKSAYRFYLMHGRAIIVVSSLMVKQVPESLTLWLVMEPIRVSCPFLARKFLRGFLPTKIKINNIKSMFLCSKFTTKKCRICWFP